MSGNQSLAPTPRMDIPMTTDSRWITTWTSSPLGPGPMPRPYTDGFSQQTIRLVLHDTSAGGSAFRVRLSNHYGTRAVTFSAVTAGIGSGRAAMEPGSCREVTFSGRRTVRLARGASVISDPIDLELPALSPLVLSMHADEATGPSTAVVQGATSYVADGDQTGDGGGDIFTDVGPLGYFVSAVDVLASHEIEGAVAGFGDSITAMGWPGHLARRIFASNGRKFGVANAGISGNRVLRDGIGDNALARMDRDVLSHHGIRAVIYMQGVNDLGFPYIAGMGEAAKVINEDVFDLGAPTVDELIAAHQQIINRAHAHGLSIFGSVLTPFKGAGYWSEEGEKARKELNDWIRNGSNYDVVLDFASAVADPADPDRLLPSLDVGDHLHPNPEGQKALADSIDLALFESI